MVPRGDAPCARAGECGVSRLGQRWANLFHLSRALNMYPVQIIRAFILGFAFGFHLKPQKSSTHSKHKKPAQFGLFKQWSQLSKTDLFTFWFSMFLCLAPNRSPFFPGQSGCSNFCAVFAPAKDRDSLTDWQRAYDNRCDRELGTFDSTPPWVSFVQRVCVLVGFKGKPKGEATSALRGLFGKEKHPDV